jgi:leucyl aminopeptidase
MEINVVSGDIASFEADAIIINYFEGMERPEGIAANIDGILNGAISKLAGQDEIKGKLNEITIIHSLGRISAGRVVIIGLGKKEELSLDKVRGAVAEACRFLRVKGVKSIATVAQGAGIAGITAESSAQAITEGALLGLYTFRKHITKEAEHGEVDILTIVDADGSNVPGLEAGYNKGKIMAEAVSLARDMVNEAPNHMTPTSMAEIAIRQAEIHGLEITVLDREQMQELGMGGLLGVSQGSIQPPKFIVMSYKGKTSDEVDLALVGKGITFDSGGISIKPSEGMADMKGDMAGGASVLAALVAIAGLKPKINVTAIIAATENLPGGSAMKPGDIISAMNGESIEVLNTDAEGRLILADALSYAVKKLSVKAIVDVATLTGACQIALGNICTGLFSNNRELADKVITAGNEVGERSWQMPMFDEYREQLKSDVADIKNIGDRYGGAITAAKFLADFVNNTPWVHLDIAGTSDTKKEKGYLVKGATGVPVRTMVNLVVNMAD